MKKNAIIIAVAMLISASMPSALGLINLSTKLDNIYEEVEFQVVNIDEDTIQININPSEFVFGKLDTEKGMFATIGASNYAFTLIEGEAKLPVIRRLIEIPQDSNPEISLTSISWDYTTLEKLNLPDKIIPAQQSIEKIPELSQDFIINNDYYAINSFIPTEIANIVQVGEIRGHRFALVEISPIQYKPATGELKIMNSCVITVNLPNSDMIKTYEKIKRYSTPSYENLLNTAFENYGFYEKDLKVRSSEGYLVIVDDAFYDEIQPLVTQKESMGYEVTTIKTSEIPGGATKENIYDYIEDAYNTWTIPPAYVLLVGDTPQIPTYAGSDSYSEADLYYVTVDGSDFIPDIYIGRFPGSEESHIEAMVDKTVHYEQGGFSDFEWIKKGAFIASSDYGQLAEETHNYVIDNFLDPNGYTCDKIYEASGGSTSDITNALNEGRSLCIYSGHGYPGGWSCVPFDQNDVQSLTNEGMYPFICSHACSTNTFSDSECYGETWVREANKAAIAFWGASASTLWDEDDILERAMFQAWWEDDLNWIGGMTDMALIYLYENYSGGGYTQYYFEAYNVNGDPSIRIWSNMPSGSPTKPTKPDGPDEWIQNVEVIFSSSTTDPEEDNIYYLFDWGDGTDSGWVGPYTSGQTGEASHSWSELGEYEIKFIAKDINNAISNWSDPHVISIIENEPPTRVTINGPTWGWGGTQYDFTFESTDQDGHDIYYLVDWDDGNTEEWIGPYSSGEAFTLSHSWKEKGGYWIKAWAKDEVGGESAQASFKINILTNANKEKSKNLILTQTLGHIIEHLSQFINL
jgi:hypothetical protein